MYACLVHRCFEPHTASPRPKTGIRSADHPCHFPILSRIPLRFTFFDVAVVFDLGFDQRRHVRPRARSIGSRPLDDLS